MKEAGRRHHEAFVWMGKCGKRLGKPISTNSLRLRERAASLLQSPGESRTSHSVWVDGRPKLLSLVTRRSLGTARSSLR